MQTIVIKDLAKSEIKNLNDDYVLVLYKIIKALESLTSNDLSKKINLCNGINSLKKPMAA